MSEQLEERVAALEEAVSDLVELVSELAERIQRPAVQEWIQSFKARGRS